MKLGFCLKRVVPSRSISRCVSVSCRLSHSGDAGGTRVRFAPSPTGHLHLGGLRTALYNYLFSRTQKGKFILRIEDTDQSRLVPGAVERLVEMLLWTGIEIDEGPFQGGSFGPYVQSERLPLYSDHAQKLLENGTAYRCFCSAHRLELLRKQAATRGEVHKYDNRCRYLTSAEVEERLALKTPYVIRFKLESHAESWHDIIYGPITCDVAKIEGDPILMKSDGYPTYHLANVVDDHLMKISHVLRGVEWQVSTTKHILMYKAFRWQPPLFGHLPLLQNKDGKKLSKRQNDVQVEHYKDAGYFPEAVLNLLTNMGSGFTIRQTAGMNMQQLIQHFDLLKLNTNSTRVDFDKLSEFNRLHLKRTIGANFQTASTNLVQELRQSVLTKLYAGDSKTSLAKEAERRLTDDYLKRVLEWSKDRICLVSDLLQPQYTFLWSAAMPVDASDVAECATDAKEMIQQTVASIGSIPDKDFGQDEIAARLNSVGRSKNWKYSQYMKLLRKGLTGCLEGPSVAEIMVILGRETALGRLNQVVNQVLNNLTSEKTAQNSTS